MEKIGELKYIFSWHDHLKTLTIRGPLGDPGAAGDIATVKAETFEEARTIAIERLKTK